MTNDDPEQPNVGSGWVSRVLTELPEQQQQQQEIVAAVDLLEKLVGTADAHGWVDASSTDDGVVIYVLSLGLLYRLRATARGSSRSPDEPDGGIVKAVRWTIRPDDEYLLSIEYSENPPATPATEQRWAFTLDRQKEKLAIDVKAGQPGAEFALQLAKEIDRVRRSGGS
jgi:hypothetical protein